MKTNIKKYRQETLFPKTALTPQCIAAPSISAFNCIRVQHRIVYRCEEIQVVPTSSHYVSSREDRKDDRTKCETHFAFSTQTTSRSHLSPLQLIASCSLLLRSCQKLSNAFLRHLGGLAAGMCGVHTRCEKQAASHRRNGHAHAQHKSSAYTQTLHGLYYSGALPNNEQFFLRIPTRQKERGQVQNEKELYISRCTHVQINGLSSVSSRAMA